jgi:hypothetical protein
VDADILCMPFDPTSVGGLVMWFDPSDNSTITSSGGLVSQLNDKSGNGNHATASGSARPTFRQINGVQGLDFNGTSNLLTAPTFGWTGTHTVFQVVQCDTNGSFERHCWGNESAVTQPTLAVVSSVWMVYDGAAITSSISVDQKPHVLTATYTDAATAKLWMDGVVIAGPGNVGSSDFGSTAYIGGESLLTNYWDGAIGETILYNTVHTALNQQLVENYLLTKWDHSGFEGIGISNGLSTSTPGWIH